MADQRSYAGRKILVTGASGFVGRHLCRRLCKEHAEVIAVSRRSQVDSIDEMCWWRADLADGEAVTAIVKSVKPDVIFHLASRVDGSRDISLVLPTLYENLLTTVNLLRTASELGCRRLVLTGSLEEPPLDEPNPVLCSPYAAAKWASSGYSRMFEALYQLPVITLRLFMVYGPAQQDIRKLVPYVILSLLRGEAPKLTSGDRPVDWIYVEDVVEGFLAAGLAPDARGTVDIGSGKLVSIRKFVERLVEETNPQIRPLFGAYHDRPLEQIRTANTSMTAQRIGWTPSTSLNEGVKRTVEWYVRSWGSNLTSGM